jgi:hypothetical protein
MYVGGIRSIVAHRTRMKKKLGVILDVFVPHRRTVHSVHGGSKREAGEDEDY